MGFFAWREERRGEAAVTEHKRNKRIKKCNISIFNYHINKGHLRKKSQRRCYCICSSLFAIVSPAWDFHSYVSAKSKALAFKVNYPMVILQRALKELLWSDTYISCLPLEEREVKLLIGCQAGWKHYSFGLLDVHTWKSLNVVVWIFFFYIKQIKKVLVKSCEVEKITVSWFESEAIFFL